MPEISRSILAVTVGRSRLGIAVFRNGTLTYYGGKSLRQYSSESDRHGAIHKFLHKLFHRYGINSLAMTDLNKQQRHSPAVISVDSYVRSIAKDSHVTIRKYDAVTVRMMICEKDKPTKDNTAAKLVERYGELGRYHRGANSWERRYYGFVFSAIAIGEVFTRDLRVRDRSTIS